MEGLFWGASKLVPVGYGIKKLQIMCTIVDDLVSIDTMIEEQLTVEPINEYVQSCDIVAFNKICKFPWIFLLNSIFYKIMRCVTVFCLDWIIMQEDGEKASREGLVFMLSGSSTSSIFSFPSFCRLLFWFCYGFLPSLIHFDILWRTTIQYLLLFSTKSQKLVQFTKQNQIF